MEGTWASSGCRQLGVRVCGDGWRDFGTRSAVAGASRSFGGQAGKHVHGRRSLEQVLYMACELRHGDMDRLGIYMGLVQ